MKFIFTQGARASGSPECSPSWEETPCSAGRWGIRWADLDEFGYLRVATAHIPEERIEFELSGSTAGLDQASDTALCVEGFATLTLLSPVQPQPFPPSDPTEVWRPT